MLESATELLGPRASRLAPAPLMGAEDFSYVLERVPGVLPLDLTATVSVQADKPSVEWRRRLIELLGPSGPA